MSGELRRWRLVESVVLCTEHGCVHDRDTNPYDMVEASGPVDECGPDDWMNLCALGTAAEIEGY